MSKQIKIGFDKIPVPEIQSVEPLYDINTGIPLKNSSGQPLYTQERVPISRFGKSSRAMSVHLNNDESESIKVEEQFPETSQVSSTLLGIPRAETQLGLFSDVSTYGLDENIWEFFRSPAPLQPLEWTTRDNPTYGPRFFQRLEEISNEQAIALTAFPTPWTYPFGPTFEDVGLYNETLFERYKRFVTLGNVFHSNYSSRGFVEFANENFLSSNYAIVDSGVPGGILYNETQFTIQEVFAEIEKWTLAWMKLRDSQLFDPLGEKIRFPDTFDSTNTTPGYRSQVEYYCQLESKKVFRYQPGRISGFTFGVRASTDSGSLQNIIEWGAANDTDEYMFQIKGSQFNLVRRSTIPLPEKNLNRMGLAVGDQIFKPVLNPWRRGGYGQPDTNQVTDLWETVISRDKFNGDSLDGNGPSGYVISFEEVTMYKIEFSWYGAIGAKFYAYVPSGNGDARWVLIHTLVIENELGKPCLNDPYFKFRYVLALSDTSNLTYPQYIYKYGASYYIDGGDEGTTTNHSYSSSELTTNSSNTRSLIGITAKNEILNKDGIPTKNRKDILPTKLTVSSSTAARIDVIECEGCPGHGHHYAPNLINGTRGIVGSLTISDSGTTASFVPNNPADTDYVNDDPSLYTKIIAPGIYDAYVYKQNESTLGIARRSAQSSVNNDISKQSTFLNTNQVKLPNGVITTVKGITFNNVRLTSYKDIIASTVPLVKKNISVNFLNPNGRDGTSHFADFFIGVTEKEPTVDIITGNLLFDNQPLALEKLLFTEYAQYSSAKDINGIDTTEWDPRVGNVFEMDPRLKIPAGVTSGRCSTVLITVEEFRFTVEYSIVNPVTFAAGNYLIFSSPAISEFDSLDGGELAVRSETTGQLEGSGIFFIENSSTRYSDPNTGVLKYYIQISSALTITSEIFIRVVTMSGRYVNKTKAFSWDLYPLYIVVGMRDLARINNITLEEFDEISKFSHTPSWIASSDCNISVVNSGITSEGFSPTTGLFQAGGVSTPGDPPTNFISINRLDSAQVDTQLQQPLRPGEIRSSIFLGDNETAEIDLKHIFGQDRYVITPGLLNAKATFITAKAISTPGVIQINLNTKEQ